MEMLWRIVKLVLPGFFSLSEINRLNRRVVRLQTEVKYANIRMAVLRERLKELVTGEPMFKANEADGPTQLKLPWELTEAEDAQQLAALRAKERKE